ncbi:MAG: hypothetical protein PHQ78_07585 [Candidatus Cloacimonetes bacterium]|nr:hypothetical protein [Candidatus Cloacimonadota bacterium]MDD4559911.1 hypothetical protein [Candidatus Cloacimonadota bacterium]
MGTQQILLIVLSVIIVGAAIAVGIQMFNSQAYSANKSAIAADAQSFASQIVQFYKTPKSQGGAGGDLTGLDAADVAGFIGFMAGSAGADWDADEYGIKNDNGIYTITSVTPSATAGADETVGITGIGTEERDGKSPKIVTTITFPACEITAEASDEAVASDE